ncbi:MAG TPA: MBL fold metallo-hydrolase [Bryobacteraceae bacterium]|nr:MBL fold metallo-hydrolase [Bryobacteraceae bacterium]
MPQRNAALADVTSLGTWVYRTAPRFWKQYSAERKRAVRPAPFRPDPKAWGDRGLFAAWLGHSTVLLKVDGVTILTDPVFGRKVGLSIGPLTLGVKRMVEPALRIPELPKIDLVLLSHAHFDHFDLPSLRRLQNRGTVVVTASKTADLLRCLRFRALHELGWGERIGTGHATIRALEVNHWGARMRTDTYRGYNGYAIEAGGYRVLFGGDTAYTTAFRALKSAHPFDLAIMPVGAYDPWIHYHATPEQAWQMANDAGASRFLPVHHQTFALGREPYLEPVERLMRAAGAEADRIVLHSIGQEFRV